MVLGASFANRYSLLAISKLRDIDLIVLDGNPQSIGKDIGAHFGCVNITDSAAVMDAARKYNIDGIFSINDHGMRSAAYTAAALSLKGMSMATANAVLDKGIMREVWSAAGIAQPDFRVITAQEEIADFAERVGYPLVIKPVDCGGGGRGVFVIHSSADIQERFTDASRFLNRNNRLIVEQFIEGTETSVELVRFNEKTRLMAFSDKVKAPYSSRVATEISYLGQFTPETVERIQEISDRIMLSLGLREGIGHIEYIVTNDGSILVLEIGARAGGGHTFHPIASHVSGLNYPEWIANFYLGKAESPKLKPYRGACYAFFHAEKPGTLIEVTGLEDARSLPSIHCVECWKQPGDHVSALENSMERVGCVVALAETRIEAVEAARQAKELIRLNVSNENAV